MSVDKNNQSEITENTAESNTYISENVECQKMLKDFEEDYPKEPREDFKQLNYNVFYSPVRKSCIWTYEEHYASREVNEDCFYIIDLFDPVYEEEFCETAQNYWDFYSEYVRHMSWKQQYPFYINGYYEGEWLKEDRIQYLKWNIKESDINYKKYAHPKSYEHTLCN